MKLSEYKQINSLEFHFQNDNKIIYNCVDDTFTFIGNFADKLNNYFLKTGLKDTLKRFQFIKNTPVSKVTLKNYGGMIENFYEQRENVCFDNIIENMFPETL
jgi:hypothetical protein